MSEAILTCITLIVILSGCFIAAFFVFDIIFNSCDGIKDGWNKFSKSLEFIVDFIFDYFSGRKQAKLDAARKHKRKVKDLYYSFLGYKVK